MPTEQPETATEETGDDSLEAECRFLFAEAKEAKERLAKLASTAAEAGHGEIAKLYREISGTVLTLFMDLTATCGSGFGEIGEEVEKIYAEQQGEVSESVLLKEDGARFVSYLEQVLRIARELEASAPEAQREGFTALVRMTTELITFTKEITLEEEVEGEETDDEPEGDAEES